MAFLRETFRQETITPKLHMSESHSVPFKKNGDQVLDCMGNRVQRVIHAQFNALNWYLLQSKTWHTATKVYDERELYKTAPKVKTVPTRKRKIQPEE